MQFGLIPPIPDLHRTPKTGFHLILSHLLDDERYMQFYQQRRLRGDYLILDNGAHELGAGEVDASLLRKCGELRAQEMVLPDVLFDRRGTVERTKRMLKWIVGPGWETYQECGAPRLMFVPQGSDRAEWATCIKLLFETWDLFTSRAPGRMRTPVVGVSKDYDEWRSGLIYLIGKYVQPYFYERDFDVHCLGWPSNLWTLAGVACNFPWIRSTDSAKPFVYAKNGILLEPGGKVPRYPKRDPNYFTEGLAEWTWKIAQRNCQVFQATATDELVHSAYPV